MNEVIALRSVDFTLAKRSAYCLALAAALNACASKAPFYPRPVPGPPFGVDAEAQILLRTVAELARTGADAICNPIFLEKKLNIKISAPLVNVSENKNKTNVKVEPVSERTEFEQASYGTFSDNSGISCHLFVFFKKPLICNMEPNFIREIFKEEERYSAPFPGRTTRGVYYAFRPSSGFHSGVNLGMLGARCINGFSISAKGENP